MYWHILSLKESGRAEKLNDAAQSFLTLQKFQHLWRGLVGVVYFSHWDPFFTRYIASLSLFYHFIHDISSKELLYFSYTSSKFKIELRARTHYDICKDSNVLPLWYIFHFVAETVTTAALSCIHSHCFPHIEKFKASI